MTPTEKASDVDQASSRGISLGQLFREAGAAYDFLSTSEQAEQIALEATSRRSPPSSA
jgi:hypothetical protein